MKHAIDLIGHFKNGDGGECVVKHNHGGRVLVDGWRLDEARLDLM